MQFLNDDSNEWMRKAAEDYPVKPFGMNWETVAKQLPEEATEKEYAGYALMRYVALVVFFMLLSLVCNKYLRIDFDNRYAATGNTGKNQHTAVAPPALETSEPSKTVKPATGIGNRFRSSVPSAGITKTSTDKVLTEVSVVEQTLTDDEKPTSLISSVPSIERKMTNAGELPLSEPIARTLSDKGVQVEDEVHNATQKTENKKDIITKKRLYAGLMFGPDISSVKFQKTEGLGFNVGLLLGYKLSSKWQLESGVLLNRKEYYSRGEYFNTSRTYLPSHAYITKIDGYCTMFEIPLNVRYNISQKKQANWFAVAGLSSYLMNKEDYNYTYKRYNVEYKGNKVYRNMSKEWLTAVNASIGYEKAISEKVRIRLEPYLKLPLRGMGTGKLPISSAGMNVGISYPIK